MTITKKNEDLQVLIRDALQIMQVLEISNFDEIDLALLSRLHRAKKNLSIEAAAKKIGITRQLLSDVEDGKLPQKAKLKLMSEFYGEGFKAGADILYEKLSKQLLAGALS